MKIDITRFLDLRYKSKNNTYPVYIRFYYNRKYDLVGTGIRLTEEQFENLHSSKIKPILKDAFKKIVDVEALGSNYIEGNNPYAIKLIRQYVTSGSDKVIPVPSKKNLLSLNVFDWFERKIDMCKRNKQFGSAESYASTKSVFKEMFKTSDLPFSFFTVEQLQENERSLVEKRCIEVATIGKHARNLRHIFKLAINEGIIPLNIYPFGRYKYVIPDVIQAKKSLTRKMMSAIINYTPFNYFEKRALSFFIFSYFGNGMNLKDIAFLKYKDLNGIFLQYYRRKTKNTKTKLKLIRAIVTDEMRATIAEFGTTDKSEDNYIFQIIPKGIDEEQIDTRIHTFNKTINNTLKRISIKLSFDKVITLGMARHSFANALKQEKVNIAFIQECLGHSSPSITEHYLNSFEDDIMIEHVQKLKNYFQNS